MTTVGILGATGRMGQALVARVAAAEDLVLGAAVVRPGSPDVGRELFDVRLDDTPDRAAAACDVLIDFTLPMALEANLSAAMAHGTPMVIGTTGLNAGQDRAVAEAAERLALVHAANYSSGVTLLRRLAAIAAGALDATYDVEILEAHHRHKQDAPSGTALALGEAVAAARGVTLEACGVYAREGITGPRQSGEIGFQALRGGDIVGEHTVMLAGDGERMEISHRASSRDTFASGALRAARWLIGKPAGRYDMEDVLGLRSPSAE